MNYSTDLFAEGKLAMTLGYSYELQKIRSKNPYLNFEVSEFPQLKEDADKKVTYADYWGLVVWNRSLHKDDAWAALTQFMREDVQRKYTTVFRRPTALRHYIPEQKNDPEIGVFAGQSLYAKSWYIADDVVVNEYFNEMIEAVLNKETQLQPALQRLEDKINLLVKQRAQVE
jgi:ABC-type glycerol-3-phosphate transport system substrate-binding protein